jgi:hypothetical protein
VGQGKDLSNESEGRRRVRLDHRRRGFLLDGELQEGFADEPGLPDDDRLLIARWAEHFAPERLSDAQRHLLDQPGAERPVSLAQRELQENQRELQSPYLGALFDSLSEEQRRVVEDPGSGEEARRVGYPLSVGDLARITGTTERQVRKWADDGLLPSFREGSQRRFYSAALIRAFAISGASGPEKTILRAAAQGEAGHLFQLMAAIVGRAAPRFPQAQAEQLASLAQELAWSSRLMHDVDQSDEVAEMWETALCPK